MNTYLIAEDLNNPFVKHIYWNNDTVSPMTLADELDKYSDSFRRIKVKRCVTIPNMDLCIWQSRVTVAFTRGEYLRKNILLRQVVKNVFNRKQEEI